jgi:hypothetical protein
MVQTNNLLVHIHRFIFQFVFHLMSVKRVQLLVLIVLALLHCLCVSQPSEECSLRNLLADINVAEIFRGIDTNATAITVESSKDSSSQVPGAIITVWAGPIPDAYKCQVNSHKLYAERYGYAHYIITNTTELNWEEHVNSGKFIDKYWFKLLAMLHVMKKEPKHPWVLYVDADNIFENEQEGHDLSIESHLRSIPNYHKDIHVVFADKRGFSTDFIFAKNSPMGHRFVEHFWSVSIVYYYDCIICSCSISAGRNK